MRTVRCLTGAALAVCVIAGCASPPTTGAQDSTRPSAATSGELQWPFWPVGMRIHPLTRLVTDARTGRTVIEARIELFDREEHTTKGYGQLRIDLHDLSPGSAGAGPVVTWELDLEDLAVNRERYDEVTRTYLFPLETQQEALPEKPELRAYLLSADGRPIQADPLPLRTR